MISFTGMVDPKYCCRYNKKYKPDRKLNKPVGLIISLILPSRPFCEEQCIVYFKLLGK